MTLTRIRRIEVGQSLGLGVGVLAIYVARLTARATWLVAHGGDTSFEGTFNYPAWSTIHFVPALLFVVILPFQLWPGSRRRYPRLHRIAGRVAAVAGVLFSLTGLLLPFVMPARPFGERAFMTTFACLFPILLGCGIAAARRHDFAAHRRWMLRVTAGALGPLMQRVILPLFLIAGVDSMPRFWDLFVTSAWFAAAVNFVIVEWWMRRTDALAHITQVRRVRLPPSRETLRWTAVALAEAGQADLIESAQSPTLRTARALSNPGPV
jgi:uncharacterized membrane protein